MVFLQKSGALWRQKNMGRLVTISISLLAFDVFGATVGGSGGRPSITAPSVVTVARGSASHRVEFSISGPQMSTGGYQSWTDTSYAKVSYGGSPGRYVLTINTTGWSSSETSRSFRIIGNNNSGQTFFPIQARIGSAATPVPAPAPIQTPISSTTPPKTISGGGGRPSITTSSVIAVNKGSSNNRIRFTISGPQMWSGGYQSWTNASYAKVSYGGAPGQYVLTINTASWSSSETSRSFNLIGNNNSGQTIFPIEARIGSASAPNPSPVSPPPSITAPPSRSTTPYGGPGGYSKIVMNDSFGSSKTGANFKSLGQFNSGTYGANGYGWDDRMCSWDCGKANLAMGQDHLEIRPTGGKSGFIASRFEYLPAGKERIYYEIRATTGRGDWVNDQTWPAFWLFAGNGPGSYNAQSEFDIMETYMTQAWGPYDPAAGGYAQHFVSTAHLNVSQPVDSFSISTPGIDITTTFNVYGCEVFRGADGNLWFSIYFNGRLQKTTRSGLPWKSTSPALFLGWNPGSTYWSPAIMKIDYVKAWTK